MRLSWLIVNWRLKLLSLVLTVGLLGAVAFSENPPEFATVPVRVQYVNLASDLTVVNPPLSVDVPVAGLRDTVDRFRQSAAGVSIDLSRARVGTNQVYTALPGNDIPGLTVRQPSIPIVLTIEPLETRQLDIEVRTPNRAAGISVVPEKTYATCGNATDRCQVTVSGPASVVDPLKAYVDYDVTITSADTRTSPNEPIKFEENGHPVNLRRDTRTLPPVSVTPEVVTVQVATQGGTQTKTVPVSVRVQGTQACGYQISAVDVQPPLVTVSGPIDAVSKLNSVTMDPVNLTGLSASQRVFRTAQTGGGSVTADPSQVVVTVSLSQAFSCAPPTLGPGVPIPATTPSPASSPSPLPSPTH